MAKKGVLFFLLFVFLLVYSFIVYAIQNEANLKEVQTEGRVQLSGNDSLDKKAALTRAKISAIEKVMETIVDRKLIVKNYETIANKILANAFEYIEDYNVLKDGKKDDYYYVEIKANIRFPKLVKELTDLDIFRPQRIAVSISEYIDGKESKKMSACKNAIENELVNSGHSVIHDEFINAFYATNTFNDLLDTGEAIADNLRKKVKASILIIGSVQSNLISEEPIIETTFAKLYSARALGTFKMFRLDDGEIITTVSDMHSGADISPAAANQKALVTLGRHVGDKIIENIIYLQYLQEAEE